MATGLITFTNLNGWDQNYNPSKYRISALIQGVNTASELIMLSPLQQVWVKWEFPNITNYSGYQLDLFVASIYPEANPTSTPRLYFEIYGDPRTFTPSTGVQVGDIHYAQMSITI